MKKTRELFPLGLHAFLVAFLLWWSWRRWIDVEVDGGWNLYTFWKVSEGSLLYRDIASGFGPFSVYFCALLFRCFGASLRTLALFDAGLILGMAQLIFAIFRRLGDRAVALAASLCFLVVFAFSQYQGYANFNFVTPYKLEVLHGTFLLLCLVYLLGARRRYLLAGLCWGASLTTCAEIAGTATAMVALACLAPFFNRAGLRRLGRAELLRLFLGAAIVPAGFTLYFLRFFPLSETLFHVFSALLVPFQHHEVLESKFYQHLTGLDDASGNALEMAESAAMYIGALLATAAIARASRSCAKRWQPWFGLAMLAAVYFLAYAPYSATAAFSFRALPVFALSCASGLSLAALLSKANAEKHLSLALFAVMAAMLSLRSLLGLHLIHYGFYVAMPAALLGIFLGGHAWPAWLDRRGWNGRSVRVFFLGGIAVLALVSFQQSNEVYRHKNFPVGSGADLILGVDPDVVKDAVAYSVAVDWIRDHTPPFATVAGIPDALMINYLTRRTYPGFTTMFYIPYAFFGEDAILGPWQANPPDYIVLIDRDLSEYNVPEFGITPEYGKRTVDWVHLHYHREIVIGDEPLHRQFGIEILRKL